MVVRSRGHRVVPGQHSGGSSSARPPLIPVVVGGDLNEGQDVLYRRARAVVACQHRQARPGLLIAMEEIAQLLRYPARWQPP